MPCMDLSDYKNFDVMRRLLVVPHSQSIGFLFEWPVGWSSSIRRPSGMVPLATPTSPEVRSL